jgi:hypothetical protein
MTTPYRSPFEVMMVGAFGLYALIALLAFDKVATNTLRELPFPSAHLFLALATLSCVVVLAGISGATTAWGVLIERVGLVMLSGLCTAYAIWSWTNTGIRALGFAVMMLAIAGASLWRSWQITRGVGAARKAAREAGA